MKDILRGLREQDGVHGAMVADGAGQVLAYNTVSIYDSEILNQVSRAIVSAIDSIKLLHEDWESLSAQFDEGKLDIRNLSAGPRSKSAGLTLTVIADARLTASFANVAIRVAVSKLRARIEEGLSSADAPTFSASAATLNAPPAAALSASTAALHTSAPVVASSGLSWSGFGTSSTMASSGVSVADPASSSALTLCTKTLAKSVGPMAKVFVKEAVRKLCPNRPFSKTELPSLVQELERLIEDPTEAAQFRRIMNSAP